MIESAAAAAGCWLHHTGFKVNGIYERTAHTHSQPASCSAGNGMIRTMKRSGTWTLFIVDGKRRQCCLHLSPMDVVDVQRGASSAQRLEPKTRENRKEMYVHYFVGTNNENTNECERCCCFSYSRTVHRTASTIRCYLRLALSISFLFCSVFGSTHYNHPMDMAQLRSARAGGFYFGVRYYFTVRSLHARGAKGVLGSFGGPHPCIRCSQLFPYSLLLLLLLLLSLSFSA